MSYKRYSPSSGEENTFGDLPIGMIFWKKEDLAVRRDTPAPRFVKTDDNYAVAIFLNQNDGFVHQESRVTVVRSHMMKEEDYDKLMRKD